MIISRSPSFSQETIFGLSSIADRLVGGGVTSLQLVFKTGSKQNATFHWSDLDTICSVSVDNSFMLTSIPRKRKENATIPTTKKGKQLLQAKCVQAAYRRLVYEVRVVLD